MFAKKRIMDISSIHLLFLTPCMAFMVIDGRERVRMVFPRTVVYVSIVNAYESDSGAATDKTLGSFSVLWMLSGHL